MKSANVLKKLVMAVASGFGLGLSPFASGTCGAILGIPLGLALTTIDSLWLQIALALFLTLLAVPVCDVAEKLYARKDDGRIVADEYMLLPICFIGHGPLFEWLVGGGEKRTDALAIIVVIFVVSRIVDILKPTPARQLQSVRGGWGVVLDDFAASVYTWVIVWGIKDWIIAAL